MGFEEDDKVPGLGQLEEEYLKKSKVFDQSIYEYRANQNDASSLYVKLIDEFERCILTYFAFHWTKASSVITQVSFICHFIGPKKKSSSHFLLFVFLFQLMMSFPL